MRGVQGVDLAQGGGGGVPAGDAHRGEVGGELLAAAGGAGRPHVEVAVRHVDLGHGAVRRALAGGVDALGALALGDALLVPLLLAGPLLGDLAVGALVEVADRADQLGAAAGDQRGEAGVEVGVVAHLVGQHGAQLHLVQARHQGQAEVEAAGSGPQAQQPGVLGDGRVHLVDQHDLVGGAGADLLRDLAHGLPQEGLLRLGDGDAGRRLALGGAEHEQAADDRDGEDDRHDYDLEGDRAVQPGDDGEVDADEGGEQEDAEQVEACEQNERAHGTQRSAHMDRSPHGMKAVLRCVARADGRHAASCGSENVDGNLIHRSSPLVAGGTRR